MAPSIMSSQALSLALLSAASLLTGYQLGKLYSAPPNKETPKPETLEIVTEENAEGEGDTEDDEDDEGDLADGDLAAVKPGFMEPCKMVLVVRTDLKMTSGKIAAQHATLACYKALVRKNPKLLQHWERIGQAKIALKADSEDQLLELEAIAKSLNLCARPIHDAGHTQVESGTRTVLGIGPAPVRLINEVTGNLRLL